MGSDPEVVASKPSKSTAAVTLQSKISSLIVTLTMQAKPLIVKAVEAKDKISPHVIKAKETALKILGDRCSPHEAFFLLVAVVLLLGGSLFQTLVVLAECMRVGGRWHNMKSSFAAIRGNYEAAKTQKEKDGDVKKEKGFDKIQLFLKSANEDQLTDFFNKTAMAVLTLIAALRSRFGFALVFGTSLADIASIWISRDTILSGAERLSTELVPSSQLTPAIVRLVLQSIGFFFAYLCKDTVLAIYCAFRGSQLLVSTLSPILISEGKISAESIVMQHQNLVILGGGFVAFFFCGMIPSVLLHLMLFPVTISNILVSSLINLVV